MADLHSPLWDGAPGTAAEERVAGSMPYLELLALLHERLEPQCYLEIGVRNGVSLALARRDAVGVDPQPAISVALPASTEVIALTSDQYFENRLHAQTFDFAFIDGLHLFEQTLRDFINAERSARPGSALIVDDIFPNHPAQAARVRRTRAWTGDVWKMLGVLRTYRPDLYLATLDTAPTGSLLVAGLDPANRLLSANYDAIVAANAFDQAPPDEILRRCGALDPSSPEVEALVRLLSVSYRLHQAPADAVRALRAVQPPSLSVVIVAYNMAREIPRTIRSFSPAMQRGIAASDYEIILVDNGSTNPFDRDLVKAIAPNLVILDKDDPGGSPVGAINLGLSAARGDVVGVCIDGARMASPGLLGAALAASKLHRRPIIGSIAFHLGPDMQARSVLKGYDQKAEDALLADIDWEEDGYRLFDISCFAGSSEAGWFATPSETNALFLKKEHWRSLGGYDPAFVTPGGGLVNLDTWRRACEDPTGEVIMLLGEATFHQVHGGVATNALISPWEQFHDEYVRIRGAPFAKSARAARLFGDVHPHIAKSIGASLAHIGRS